MTISIYTIAGIYMAAFWIIAAVGGAIGDARREKRERKEHDER
jgi:hypothetical protein